MKVIGQRITAGTAPAKPDQAPAQHISLRGLGVLAIDDQPDAQVAYSRIRGWAGAEVRAAESLASALAVLVTWQPETIICDTGKPGEALAKLVNLHGLSSRAAELAQAPVREEKSYGELPFVAN